MHIRKINIDRAIIMMILFFSVLTTLLQGIFAHGTIPGSVLTGICTVVFVIVVSGIYYLRKKGRLTEEIVVFAIVCMGMLLHVSYVLLTGIHDRQHDEGTFTGMGTEWVNPGHLGYIEYIYKFRKLPYINPYELFSYYHPPVYYVLSALWVTFLTGCGMAEEAAFENIQTLSLFYSGLFMFVSYLILKKMGARGKGLYAGMILITLHPGLMLMSGCINNDMLSSLLIACCILTTLCHIRKRSLRYLLLIALSIGVGMLCKLTCAAMAFPVGLVFLMDFVKVVRAGDKKVIKMRVRNYILFGITAAVTGLSWIVRNLINFGELPGVPVPSIDSVLYTGDHSLWARLGVPALSQWHFDFPFHPINGDVVHNIWIIMLQTSLFGEIYPVEATGVSLALCRIVYVAAAIVALLSAGWLVYVMCRRYRSLQQAERMTAVFVLTGYITYLISFAAFTVKYSFTCSSDFRYAVVCLIYVAIGIGMDYDLTPDGSNRDRIWRLVRMGVWACMILTTIIYMIWQWDGTI